MVQEVIISISIIIGVAALLTIIARAVKQPPIIAYIIAGIISGPVLLNLIGSNSEAAQIMQIFARLGVALLLFIVGLNLDFRILKEVGKVAVITGIGQVMFTGLAGFLISVALGLDSTTAVYLGIILSFSSTVLVIKILSDKKEMNTLHAKISLGILILQDFLAAAALIVIPSLNGNKIEALGSNFAYAFALTLFIFVLSTFVLRRFMDYLAKNQEVLFLFGIAWALLVAGLFDLFGLSLEIGALIAGMSLASNKYNLEVGGKIKPIRDFFVVLFFVFFGSQLAIETINSEMIKNALVLSAFVVIGKPVIVMGIMRFLGYKKKTNFLTGTSLAQISEFSLILVLLGFSLGQLSQEIMSLAILISLITITISSYGLYYSHGIFNRIEFLLHIFDGKKYNSEVRIRNSPEIFLFGYHRIGYKILYALKKMNMPIAVIDNNPKVIANLERNGIACLYGDAGDKNFLSEIGLENAKMVISTIPDEYTNLSISEILKHIKSNAVFIATAEQSRIAYDLYKENTDYVIVPHHLGGDFAARMIEKYGIQKERYREAGYRQFRKMKKDKDSSTFI